MAEQISPMKAILEYFESGPSGSKVSIKEMKALSSDDRKELVTLAAAELGKELVPAKTS